MILTTFELQCTTVAPGEPKQQWNGDPMASNEANDAMRAAVEAFQEKLREHGIDILNTGYGSTARVG